mgnify:CR=1 FL=1
MSEHIPFNRACLGGHEFVYMQQALEQMWLAGDGGFTKRCHAFLERLLGAPKVLLTTSCTHALELAALLLDIQPGDEVLVPSFTFVSTINAFVLRGARPVFVDVRPDTFNLDERLLEAHVTPRSRVVVPVHYAGVGCEMDAILDIAQRHGLAVVEDNAHGLFANYKGKALGTFGALATQSFHETKNVTCGEGGALIINDARYIERAEIIREKGTDRARFYRGQVDKYTWVDIGSSYLPSDILAAFLYAQLEACERLQAGRRRAWEYYERHLSDWAAQNGVRLPVVPSHCDQAYHMFYLILPSLDVRQALIQHLQAADITSAFHYQPLHLSSMGQLFGGEPGNCPVTEDVSDRLLRLPFYNEMPQEHLDKVVSGVSSFRLAA